MPNTPVRAAAEGLPKFNRRLALFGGLSAAAVLVAAPCAVAAGNPDAELIRLGKELDREFEVNRELMEEAGRLYDVWGTMVQARGLKQDDHAASFPLTQECGYSQANEAWSDCGERIDALVETISDIPAATLAGFAVKANAMLWDMFLWESGHHDSEGEEYSTQVLRGFVAELRKAGGAS